MTNWIEIGGYALGAIGAFLSGGWILNFYNARPKKNSIEIENMKQAIEELSKVIERLSVSNKEYRKEVDELKRELAQLSERIDIKHEAIYTSTECKFIKNVDDCIVMRTFKEKCREHLKSNKENIQKQ